MTMTMTRIPFVWLRTSQLVGCSLARRMLRANIAKNANQRVSHPARNIPTFVPSAQARYVKKAAPMLIAAVTRNARRVVTTE